MKKLLPIILFCLLIILIPALVDAQAPFVRCGNTGQKACTICDFFATLTYIYNFLVLNIATPLATVALTIGGICILISAGNPGLLGLGKKIVYAAIIGLVLVWCSWLIINFILTTIGFNLGNWANPNFNC